MASYTGSDKRLQYLFEHGGGGGADMWTGTQAEYTQQASQIEDGTLVNITDDDQIAQTWHVYSTTEKVVGKWIDNSDVYEKTIKITSSISLSANTWISTGISATNISMVLNSRLMNNAPANLLISITVQNNMWSINSPRSFTINTNERDWYLIVEYTKTS